ncbi:hypothetical protein JW998_11270 [candidate division KSB1 bacterium]|nr:hypothetical protein [candidate division KSB1 bacterium]
MSEARLDDRSNVTRTDWTARTRQWQADWQMGGGLAFDHFFAEIRTSAGVWPTVQSSCCNIYNQSVLYLLGWRMTK